MTRRGRLPGTVLALFFLHFAGFSQTMPTDPDSLFVTAVALQRAGDNDEAMRRVVSLLRVHPGYDDARILYGRLLAWQNQYQAALDQFDSVLSRNPSNTEARLAKAQVLAWSGRYSQSADLLVTLERESPENPLYVEELGKVYLWWGNPAEALRQYEKAYELNPGSVEVVRGLARTYRQLRSFNEARSWYQKLLDLEPNDPEAQGGAVRLAYRSPYELQLQGTYESFTKSGVKAHTIGQIELYASLSEEWKPFVHYSHVARFGLDDSRFGLGVYITPGYSVSMLVQGIFSPKAQVAPEADASVEFDAGIARGIEAVAGYRYLRFDSVTVHIAHPGMTYYFSGELWVTASAYLGFTSLNTTSNSYLVTCSYLAAPQTTGRVGVFSGSEAFRATTLVELSTQRSQGAFLAVKTRLGGSLAVEGLYQYTAHSSPSSAHLLTMTLIFLF